MVIYTDICLTDNVRQMSGSFIGNTDISSYLCNKKDRGHEEIFVLLVACFCH